MRSPPGKKTHLLVTLLVALAALVSAAEREFTGEQLQQMLRRFPNADLNKDGKLTPDEFHEFRSHRSADGAASARPSTATAIVAPTNAPAVTGTNATSTAASRAAAREAKTRAAASFDMAAYLAALSAKGKERGYKEFVYKQTPQGELRIYFALPKDWSPGDKRPVVLFFYGGSWSSGNVFSFDEQSEYFARCGVVAGMADYRVRTRHGVNPDKCVEDARSLVRWVRANAKKLGVDPDRVIAGGGSAGGHVAACTAIPDAPNSATDDLSISCVPNGLLLCYPVASFVDDARAEGFQSVFGAEMALRLSPARQVTKAWPPTVLFFGNTDKLLANGVLLHNKVREVGVAAELYLATGEGHGFVNKAPWHEVSSKYAADFFMRAGVLEKKPLPDGPPDVLRKYNGEPVEKIFVKTNGNPSKPARKGGAGKKAEPAPAKQPTPP